MIPDCIHELPLDQCSLCKAKPAYTGPFWDAKYEQMCPKCLNVIGVGDRVRWDDDGVQVIHAKHK